MNDRAFESKVNHDIAQVKKDISTLGDDGVTGLGRMFDQRAEDVKKSVSVAVKTINKDVGDGLSQYNTKLQEVANKLPGGYGRKLADYPWVTMTISMIFGLLLGVLLKPGRLPVQRISE